MAKTVKTLDDFKQSLFSEAEELVRVTFPLKVIELDSLVKSDLFKISNEEFSVEKTMAAIGDVFQHAQATAEAEPPAKRRRSTTPAESSANGGTNMSLVPSNALILGVIDRLKPEIHDLMSKCNQVKMWIQLLIPRVEDGNNFGVSIQEDAVGEVGRIEGEVVTYLDSISRYYLTRAKLVSKLIKYPMLDDYRRSVAEIDQKEFLTLRLTCCEMRNAYCILHDTITKNIEKIKKPRSNNLDSLY